MNTDNHSIPSPAAAAPRASATPSLELSAARQARDGLATLLRSERTVAAEFLLALSDFDRRRGWEPLGHASLFAFLRVELGLSSGAAFWRMSASRLLQRFPDLIGPLRDGRLCLSTTAELAKVLTDENRAEVLPRFFGLSAREAREVTAALLPREAPPLRAVVTNPGEAKIFKVAQASAAGESLLFQPATAASREDEPVPATVAFRTSETRPAGPVRGGQRDDVEPLTADLRRLHVTVSRQFLEKVEAARDGLSHALPGATTEQVLEAALDLMLQKQAKARGQVKRPRTFATVGIEAAPEAAPPVTLRRARSAPPGRSPRARAGRGSPRGLEAGRRAVPVATRFGRPMRLDAPDRNRPP